MPDPAKSTTNESESDLMKDAELGAMIQQSTKTLANQRSRSEGPPYIRLPGSGAIRYSRRAVEAWLEANTVRPGTSR